MTTDSAALDALLLLSRARAAANASLDKALSRVGLWLDDLAVLTLLDDRPLSRDDLGAALSLSASETVRRIRPMEKLSWVERTDAGIALTPTGRALLDEASGLAANRAEVWLAEASLSDSDIASLRELLSRLTE